ncbi:hypothetical protein B0H66DRAFT_605106 [Apodospora peruviana]|uniref:Uncharacterized protein n=1 Tax=Apodospora peruviana TaxID=516989 RepID=A0AAE0I3A4_9PEZI|nr:hypothetical protein B0H66DRAFT_605106 [Apodospora peruviana]
MAALLDTWELGIIDVEETAVTEDGNGRLLDAPTETGALELELSTGILLEETSASEIGILLELPAILLLDGPTTSLLDSGALIEALALELTTITTLLETTTTTDEDAEGSLLKDTTAASLLEGPETGALELAGSALLADSEAIIDDEGGILELLGCGAALDDGATTALLETTTTTDEETTSTEDTGAELNDNSVAGTLLEPGARLDDMTTALLLLPEGSEIGTLLELIRLSELDGAVEDS